MMLLLLLIGIIFSVCCLIILAIVWEAIQAYFNLGDYKNEYDKEER